MYHLILSFIVIIIVYVVIKIYEYRNYFKKWGIPQPREFPFLGVSMENIFLGKSPSIFLKQIYDLNSDAKYVGFHMFNNPVIMIRDLELIKSVLVKNFDYFANKRKFVDESADPLFGKNLAFINGKEWREMRNLLSPAFTSSKMRTMFVLMSKCAENFSEQLVKLYGDEKEVDVKDVFTKYTNDVIATCAFGIEIDSLKDPNNQFYVTGRKCFNFKSLSMLPAMLGILFPNLGKKLGLRFIPKSYANYFIDIIRTTIRTREEKGITRPDMLQLLMEARDTKSESDIIDITAQAFIFFLGGFESISSHMCLIAYVLALHQDVQDKLYNEIIEEMEKNKGEITYEIVNNMPYLDAVFYETMRMYPISYLNRMCSKDFELPPTLPDAKPYMVKEGDEILIPVCGLHADPKYYDNPEIFDPERYLNKKSITGDITNLGFGMGPRICIANRFAILETKVLFVYLLTKCKLILCEKSPVPFEYDTFSYIPAAKQGFWFKIQPRK